MILINNNCQLKRLPKKLKLKNAKIWNCQIIIYKIKMSKLKFLTSLLPFRWVTNVLFNITD